MIATIKSANPKGGERESLGGSEEGAEDFQTQPMRNPARVGGAYIVVYATVATQLSIQMTCTPVYHVKLLLWCAGQSDMPGVFKVAADMIVKADKVCPFHTCCAWACMGLHGLRSAWACMGLYGLK